MIPTGIYKLTTAVSSVLLLFFVPLSAQQDNLQKANSAYDNGHYQEAIIYFNQIEKLATSGPLLFKRGVCYYEINQMDNAMTDMRAAIEYGYQNALIDYYTAMIFHHRGDFKKAAAQYKLYLASLDPDSAERIRVRKLIKQCGNAQRISFQKPIAIVEPPSRTINSPYDDIGAIQSPNTEGRIYYTSNRPNIGLNMRASDHDIYYADHNGTQWSDAQRLPAAINRGKDELVLGFTTNADGIYFYRESKIGGEVLLNGSTTSGSSRKIGLDIPLTLYNSRVHFWNDEVIFVALNLPTGYGGYDIYAIKRENNTWGAPINLGPNINSIDDELSPYLAGDGRTLFFSSNREWGVGGYDVYQSSYLYEAESWTEPVNLGIPINSAGDELDFQMGHNGLTATFSSNRKSGLGGYDIYLARYKERSAAQNYLTEDLGFINYQASEFLATPSEGAEAENWEESLMKETVVGDISILIPHIYYVESADVTRIHNTKVLDQVAETLIANPAVTLEIIGHSGTEEIPEYTLFSSIKTAERVQQYMVEKGVRPDRMHVKGFGYNYPLIKDGKSGGDDLIAEKYNARVALYLHGAESTMVSTEHILPDLPDQLFSQKSMLYEAIVEEDLSYKIGIIITSQMYRGKLLSMYNDATIERDAETGLYLYTIGLYDTYAKALQVSRDLKRDGWVDVRIWPYVNGMRVKDEALNLHVAEFPDIKNVISRVE